MWGRSPTGHLVIPGTYSVTVSKVAKGVVTDLAGPESFDVVELGLNTFATDDFAAIAAFQKGAADLHRAVTGALKWAGEAKDRIAYTRKALSNTPNADTAMLAESQRLHTELNDILVEMRGDRTKGSRNVFTPPSVSDRVSRIVNGQWDTTAAPTGTNLQDYEWAAEAFATELGRLNALSSDLDAFEQQLESVGAPWTPGRLPSWTKE